MDTLLSVPVLKEGGVSWDASEETKTASVLLHISIALHICRGLYHNVLLGIVYNRPVKEMVLFSLCKQNRKSFRLSKLLQATQKEEEFQTQCYRL